MNRYFTFALSGLCGLFVLAAQGAGLSEVHPPVRPRILSGPGSLEEARQLPSVSQPSALRDALLDLQKGLLEERIEKLKRKALHDLVFVRGGTYMMGDFGSLVSREKLPFTPYPDNKPLHKVTLSSFSISRYKTTFAEFDVFLDATRQPKLDDDILPYRSALVSAGMVWQQAKDYCQWLGKMTGEPFDLPTEAQWEYAARSRGQNFVFATNDGNLNFGHNIDNYSQRKLILPLSDNPDKWGKRNPTVNYPVGMFPPNPLGLYDMNANGNEWMNDWYAADYYQHSPEVDPQGPERGQWKVTRSVLNGEPQGSFNNNLVRHYEDPNLFLDPDTGKPHTNILTGEPYPPLPRSYSLRCVVNAKTPISAGR